MAANRDVPSPEFCSHLLRSIAFCLFEVSARSAFADRPGDFSPSAARILFAPHAQTRIFKRLPFVSGRFRRRKMSRHRLALRTARPHTEPLEPRRLLSEVNFSVTNTNDSGSGSLRQAITAANTVA